MNNHIIRLLIRTCLTFILFTMLAACEKVNFDETDQENTSDNRISITTRANTDIEYPLHIIVLDEENKHIKSNVIESGNEDISLSLDAGTYHIVAVAGIKECQQTDFSSKDKIITLPEDNRTSTPIQMGSTDIMITQNATATITMYNQVAAFDLSLTDIPSNASSVSVSLSMLCNKLDVIGSVSGETSTNIELKKQSDGRWTAPRFYTLPSSNDRLTMSINIITPESQETYGYTYHGAIKANTPYILTGSYNQGFIINNEIALAGWSKAENISFTFGDNNEDSGPNDKEELQKMPEVGTLWNNHLVAAIDYLSDTEADIILLSLTEWSGITSAFNTEIPNMANDIAASYTEDGMKDWRIPTKEEVKLMRNSIGLDNLDYTNEMLTSNKYTPLKYGEDAENDVTIRYLCEGAKYSYVWTTNSTTQAGSKRTYHMRLVNRIKVEIVDIE